ncbi:type 2 lanthipeptide synthetase LanM [Enterococcus sp. AZ163]|uniref:type 2 lanthipeptide synthetase LanM n=1 Tax=Enterococcus sp. AZ163 TaxID=2774638 RepID=UPI003D27EBB5
MEKFLTYTLGMSILERKNLLTHFVYENNLDEYDKWISKASLLSEKHHDKILRFLGMNNCEFNSCISKLDFDRSVCLKKELLESTWFNYHTSLFKKDMPIQNYELRDVLRFHINAFKVHCLNVIEQSNIENLKIEKEVINSLCDSLCDELFDISENTIVYDFQYMTKKYKLNISNEKEHMILYLENFAFTNNDVFSFFASYPALSRSLANRLKYACDNFTAFYKAVSNSLGKLIKKFDLQLPISINSIKVSQGDSHDIGKSVLKFRCNETNLYFKFKSLEISNRFNQFLSFIEEIQDEITFYKIKRLVGDSFTIEEEIIHENNKSEEDIVYFYKSYGTILAITFWLRSTDLHMDNLIAFGKYPVIIDTETIIQPNKIEKKDIDSRKGRLETHSILSTSLIPFSKSSEEKVVLNALTGGLGQNSKKSNEDSSSIESENIPLLNFMMVNPRDYSQYIEKYFFKMNALLMKNKHNVICQIEKIFKDVEIRVLFRNTEEYYEYLSFIRHPSCSVDYIEKERVLMNLWGKDSILGKVIPYEFDALQIHDIPRFYTTTTLKSIYYNGKELKNIFSKNALEATIGHINQLTQKQIDYSFLLLKESLGTLSIRECEVKIPNNNEKLYSHSLRKAVNIGDIIVDQIMITEGMEYCDWYTIVPVSFKKATIVYPTYNLYNGILGIYVFLKILNEYYPKKKYSDISNILEIEIQENINDGNFQSAYFGEGGKLFSYFILWKLTGENSYELLVEEALRTLQLDSKKSQVNEWLGGSASLIVLLIRIYEMKPSKELKQKIIDLSTGISCKEMKDGSFSHGYGGVLYSLIESSKMHEDSTIQEKIVWYKEKFNNHILTEPKISNSWCRGEAGFNIVFDKLEKKIPKTVTVKTNSKESCICHGSFGANNYVDKIYKPIYLKSNSQFIPIDFFTGLSGIGYQILRLSLKEKSSLVDVLSIK